MPKKRRQEPAFAEKYAPEIAEIARIAGVADTDVFLYSAHPTPTQARWVFQAWIDGVPDAQAVCLSKDRAAQVIDTTLVWCREHPDEARELTQDYRS